MAEGIHFWLRVDLKDGKYPTPNAVFVETALAAWQRTLTTVAQSVSLARGLLQIPCLVCPSIALQELMPVALYQKSCDVIVLLFTFCMLWLRILVTSILKAVSCSHRSMLWLNLKPVCTWKRRANSTQVHLLAARFTGFSNSPIPDLDHFV